MNLTVETLISAGIAPAQAREFAQPLALACQRFEIATPARLAGFVAQCRVESAGFTQLTESLFYRDPERIARIFRTAFDLDRDRVVDPEEIALARQYVGKPEKLANRIYANRLGNGDEASGDGWRYRGRGLKQLTGKDNYADAGESLGRPYVDRPELVALPEDACLTAAWFWHTNKCNLLADRQEWDAVTRVVNGPGMLQAAERRQYSIAGLTAFTSRS